MQWFARYCNRRIIVTEQNNQSSYTQKALIPAIILLILTGVAVFFILVFPTTIESDLASLTEGQVAPRDIIAPTDIEYISTVRTNQARDAAERTISSVYTPPDSGIARRQIDKLNAALDDISDIRDDETTSDSNKIKELQNVADLVVETQIFSQIVSLSDSRWNLVSSESLRLLEYTMRSPIREDNIEQTKMNLHNSVSYLLDENEVGIVVNLVTPLIVTNSFFSQELTDAAIQQARQSVAPVTQVYLAGESVVQRGRILTAVNIEALEMSGVISPQDPINEYVGTASIVSVLFLLIVIYLYREKPSYLRDKRNLLILLILLILFIITGRFVIPNRTVLPYVFPIPAFGMLITTLFGTGSGIMFSILISILTPYNLANGTNLAIFYLITSLSAVLTIGKAQRISFFAWAAFVQSLFGVGVLIGMRMPAGDLDLIGYLTLVGAIVINGIASASLALLLQYSFSEMLGLTTGLRLLEISRSDAPLLKHFLRTAPGSYQHSLMVANMVEQAGEKLDLDTLLLRVGALYHDVGKTVNPAFFIENQLPTNLDPHDDMDPAAVAQTVILHVAHGVELAKKYRLPGRIIDFMLEHHGTLTARYLYNRAMNEAKVNGGKVDVEKFKYPGPTPRSKETGLLMLADNVEARTRSERPKSESEIESIVQSAIDFCQHEGQLNSTNFTFRDLALIKESFVTTLTGLYHPRIAYPTSPQTTESE